MISLAEHAEKYCEDDDKRNEVYRIMLQLCSESKDPIIKEKGKYYYKKLPSIRHSREVYARFVMEGEEYRAQILKNIIYEIDLAECCVRQLITPDMPLEEKLFYYQKAAGLYEVVLDSKYEGFYDPPLLYNYYNIAAIYVKLGRSEIAADYMKRIFEALKKHMADSPEENKSKLLHSTTLHNSVTTDQTCKLDFIYNAIHISALPIYYAKEEYSPEEFEWMGEFFQPEFKRKVKIALIGKQTFENIEKIIWRLSEFVFLCYEDMFFYDRLTVFVGENQYVLKCFNRTDNRELRKRSLRTKDKKSNDFCNKALNGKNFINFMTFREESGIVFDVFRTTAYSNSFREDYPLRLSQTMEGLANYLMIANIDRPKYKAMQTNTADKLSGFEIAISSSLTTVIDVFSPFSSDSEKIEFCREIKEHRHKFSHVKMKGDYIHGKKNEQYAEILYTVIRVSIIKRIFGLI